jgi:hypothetical protein
VSDFSISSAYVLTHCRFPFRVDVTPPPDVAENPDRDKGNAVHACCATFINTKGVEETLDPAEHPTWACAKVWILANRKLSWVAEPAYAWNPAAGTARELGVNIGRAYEEHGKLPHEVGGTLDVASVEGDTVYVYEFGTGFDVEHKYDQLRLQCGIAARALGVTKAVGQIVKFRDDGAYPLPPVHFDAFALAATRGEFAEYLAAVDDSEPEPGEHCARCNLKTTCPAGAAIVAELVPVEALVPHRWGLTISSPDHAAWLLGRARLVAAAAEAVKDGVKAYVPKEGLVLADGSLLVEGTRNMPRRDNKKLEMLARTLGATDEQLAGCDYVAVESSGLKVKKAPAPKAKKKAAA